MIILKYVTAALCVAMSSGVASEEPQSLMMGFAVVTKTMLRITAAMITKQKAVRKIRFASSLCFAPKRLATSAETDTLTAKKRESPMNLGWVVSPTAATA